MNRIVQRVHAQRASHGELPAGVVYGPEFRFEVARQQVGIVPLQRPAHAPLETLDQPVAVIDHAATGDAILISASVPPVDHSKCAGDFGSWIHRNPTVTRASWPSDIGGI